MQDAGVDADFLIAVLLPGVVLDHVEQLSNKKQDSVFRVVLVENQNKRINNPKFSSICLRKLINMLP